MRLTQGKNPEKDEREKQSKTQNPLINNVKHCTGNSSTFRYFEPDVWFDQRISHGDEIALHVRERRTFNSSGRSLPFEVSPSKSTARLKHHCPGCCPVDRPSQQFTHRQHSRPAFLILANACVTHGFNFSKDPARGKLKGRGKLTANRNPQACLQKS